MKRGEQPYARQPDTSLILITPKETIYIQTVVGTSLYYAQVLDNTMLPTLNDIGTQQSHPTTKIMETIQQLLDNANTYKNVHHWFCTRDM